MERAPDKDPIIDIKVSRQDIKLQIKGGGEWERIQVTKDRYIQESMLQYYRNSAG